MTKNLNVDFPLTYGLRGKFEEKHICLVASKNFNKNVRAKTKQANSTKPYPPFFLVKLRGCSVKHVTFVRYNL